MCASSFVLLSWLRHGRRDRTRGVPAWAGSKAPRSDPSGGGLGHVAKMSWFLAKALQSGPDGLKFAHFLANFCPQPGRHDHPHLRGGGYLAETRSLEGHSETPPPWGRRWANSAGCVHQDLSCGPDQPPTWLLSAISDRITVRQYGRGCFIRDVAQPGWLMRIYTLFGDDFLGL